MIDFSKMTPELYEKIQNLRKSIDQAKNKIALAKLDDDYNEAVDGEQFIKLTKWVNEMSEELEKYEI
jgi:Zn-dependent M16 (insulinase) family peptidase